MRRIDLIKFNAELLQKMQSCGIKLNDWQYVNLYNDYEEMLASGTKKTAISLILAEKYNLSERQFYNIIKHLKSSVSQRLEKHVSQV